MTSFELLQNFTHNQNFELLQNFTHNQKLHLRRVRPRVVPFKSHSQISLSIAETVTIVPSTPNAMTQNTS